MCSDYDYSAHDFNSDSYSEEKNQLNAEHEVYLKGFREGSEKARKKGHWLYPTDIKGFCRCEYCGALWGRDLYENRFFKYCPRCGADMRGDED